MKNGAKFPQVTPVPMRHRAGEAVKAHSVGTGISARFAAEPATVERKIVGPDSAERESERRPLLTLFHGPPGAGKTTLARRLEADGAGVRICTDDWQDALGPDLADDANHEQLQAVLYRHAMTLLEHGVDVILEDGLWMRDERRRVFADARIRRARIHWNVFEVSADELHRRIAARNAVGATGAVPIPRAELERILALVELPTAAERAAVDVLTVHR